MALSPPSFGIFLNIPITASTTVEIFVNESYRILAIPIIPPVCNAVKIFLNVKFSPSHVNIGFTADETKLTTLSNPCRKRSNPLDAIFPTTSPNELAESATL